MELAIINISQTSSEKERLNQFWLTIRLEANSIILWWPIAGRTIERSN